MIVLNLPTGLVLNLKYTPLPQELGLYRADCRQKEKILD